jgi:phosphoserine phosphatase RsbU/P
MSHAGARVEPSRSKGDALIPDDQDDAMLHVLVVDDAPVINRLVQIRLQKHNYRIASAESAEAALPLLEAEPPDLIFLDVSMPGMSGVELLQLIRSRGLDVAVVMMTAFGSEQVAIDALRAGADDYLRKPFETVDFELVLERTVSRLLLRRKNALLQARLEQKHRQLEAELARAGQVQANLLPRRVPEIPGFDLAAICVPAFEVGGDFYDWLEPVPGTFAFALGDVMGKGMPAALWMATARTAMRAAISHHSPAEAVECMLKSLGDDLEHSEQFVTLFLAQLDVASRRLTYVDAGHGLTFLRRYDSTTCQVLEPRGLPLGVMAGERYEDGTLALQPGDTLIVYSDGLLDTCVAAERDCVAAIMRLDNISSARSILDQLLSSASRFMPLGDDLTIVVLHCRNNQEINGTRSR